MQDSLIEAIRAYFSACPLIDSVVGVDQMDEDNKKETGYSIQPFMPASVVLQKYTDGTQLRQYTFNLQSLKTWSIDFIDTTENLDFFQALSEWIEEQNKQKNLPDIFGIQSLEVISSGYLLDAQMGIAVYQIQCRLVYLHY